MGQVYDEQHKYIFRMGEIFASIIEKHGQKIPAEARMGIFNNPSLMTIWVNDQLGIDISEFNIPETPTFPWQPDDFEQMLFLKGYNSQKQRIKEEDHLADEFKVLRRSGNHEIVNR